MPNCCVLECHFLAMKMTMVFQRFSQGDGCGLLVGQGFGVGVVDDEHAKGDERYQPVDGMTLLTFANPFQACDSQQYQCRQTGCQGARKASGPHAAKCPKAGMQKQNANGHCADQPQSSHPQAERLGKTQDRQSHHTEGCECLPMGQVMRP